MNVDVINTCGFDSRVLDGFQHHTPWSINVGRGHMEGVRRHPIPDNLGIYLGATSFGVLQLFQKQNASAFAVKLPLDQPVHHVHEGHASAGAL